MKLSVFLILSMATRLLLMQRSCRAFTTTTPARGRILVTRQPLLQRTIVRHFAGTSDDGDSDDDQQKKNKNRKPSKKFTVNDNITERNTNLLQQAFADLAKKEGMDKGADTFYADDETFNDDFDDPELSFEDDDYVDTGGSSTSDDMEERIRLAQQDMDLGRVSVPKDMDSLKEVDLRRLGFKREMNPFGDDETPRKDQFKLITKAMTCSACGSDFQSANEAKPGYLPSEKFDIQVKLNKIEELQRLQDKANMESEWSPEDEIEYLIQTSEGGAAATISDAEENEIDIDAMAKEMGLDLFALAQKKVICKRCHGLQNFGKVDDALRPGWTKEPLLLQDQFLDLLTPLREKPAVIIALVDLFDFSGSILKELDAIAGDNPVIIAANKADLMPSKMGPQRVENWVRRELEYLGVKSLANVGGAVRLVSAKTGYGINGLLGKARMLAEEDDCDVYVVGAANAGKSSLLNLLLERSEAKKPHWQKQKKRAGNANARKGALTVSGVPGTTLKFIKMELGDGRSLYDTPGLLVPGTLTQLLSPEELKIVCPKKAVEPITFRVSPGKCVLIGGLARIEVLGDDDKAFMFTFFVANDIKLHPTDSEKAEDVIRKHTGTMLTPPVQPYSEDMEFEHHDVEIEGAGWKEAAADISLCGLGWVAVTGPGLAKVRVTVPKGVNVAVRPPLMPFDIWEVASRHTGGRAVRKTSRTKYGKKRKGVGRR